MADTNKVSAMTAQGVPIVLKGKEYTLSPLGVNELGVLEKWMCNRQLAQLQEQFAQFPDLFPQELRKTLVLEAVREGQEMSLTKSATMERLQSIEAIRVIVWLSLRKCHPEVTQAGVFDLVEIGDLENLKGAIDRVSGLADSGDKDKDGASGEAPAAR